MSKSGNLPATKTFLESEAVKGNAVWGVIRTNLQEVVAGTLKPADAAKKVPQTAAEGVLKLTSP